MMLFVTHPKYFDKRAIRGKKIDLGFVFDSKRLYDSFDFKCVNIGKDGKIRNENFFPKEIKLDINKDMALNIKIGVYSYLKKRDYKIKSKYLRTAEGYRDFQYRFVVSHTRDIAKKDFNKALSSIEEDIYDLFLSIAKDNYMLSNYIQNLITLYNIINAFFEAYICSLGYNKNEKMIIEILQYTFLLNIIEYYTFDRNDIDKNGFNNKYLKILSRLFIEHIHKINIEEFIQEQYRYYNKGKYLLW